MGEKTGESKKRKIVTTNTLLLMYVRISCYITTVPPAYYSNARQFWLHLNNYQSKRHIKISIIFDDVWYFSSVLEISFEATI